LGDQLEKVCFRVGMLAAVRARQTGRMGVMITASHNEKQDNGVKIVERDGSMMVEAWEPLAVEFANAADVKAVLTGLESEESAKRYGLTGSIYDDKDGVKPQVYVGNDTRDTSPMLAKAVIAGIESCGAAAVFIGVVTTP